MRELKNGDWILKMNPMTGQSEARRIVCIAETREELELFVARESVELYRDGRWAKSHRKGGPLEWMNPPDNDSFQQHFERPPPQFLEVSDL